MTLIEKIAEKLVGRAGYNPDSPGYEACVESAKLDAQAALAVVLDELESADMVEVAAREIFSASDISPPAECRRIWDSISIPGRSNNAKKKYIREASAALKAAADRLRDGYE